MVDSFVVFAYSSLFGEEYSTGYYNDLVLSMIEKFVDYMNTLNPDDVQEFKTIANNVNDINTNLGEERVDYGATLLKLYKSYYNLNH